MKLTLAGLAFVIIGLYLVITNLIDMVRDPVPANIGVQAVSLAMGGGLVAYGLNYGPVIATVDMVAKGVKDLAKETGKGAAAVAKEVTKS